MTENLPDTNVGNIKYINKQDAVDALEAKKDKSAKGDIGCFYNTIIQNTIDALNGLPSADVVQVVRCKDCLFFTTEKSCCRPEGLTKAREDAFCSYGERKE